MKLRIAHVVLACSVSSLAGPAGAATYPPGPAGTCTDTLTIVRVQDPGQACHPAPPDTVLGLRGIVTAIDSLPGVYAFYMQMPGGGPYSGIQVFTAATNYRNPVPGTPTGGNLFYGDLLAVDGRVLEAAAVTQMADFDGNPITNDIVIRRVSAGNPFPPFHVGTCNGLDWVPGWVSVNGTADQEPYEGCVVRVRGPLVCGRTAGPGLGARTMIVSAPGGPDSIAVDGAMLTFVTPLTIGSAIDSVQGILSQAVFNGIPSYRVLLRNAGDLFAALPPNLVGAACVQERVVRVTFDRPVTAASAQNTSNYTLASAGAIVSATLEPGGSSALVVTGGGALPGQTETIFVSGIVSTSGLALTGTQSRSFVVEGPALAFAQLSFDSDGGPVLDTDIGRCGLTYTPIAFSECLNVIVRLPGGPQAAWVVRNLYLPDDASAPPVENLTARFPLSYVGIAPGTPVSSLEYDLRMTPSPMLDSDTTAWFASPYWRPVGTIDHPVIDFGHITAPPMTVTADPGLVTWFEPNTTPSPTAVSSWIGCNMTNIDLDDSTFVGDRGGCGPASCANSLTWLKGQHSQIDLPPNVRTLFQQLGDLMNRVPPGGVGPKDILRAKLDLIEAYGLPIRVDYQSGHVDGAFKSSSGLTQATSHNDFDGAWPTEDFIKSEVANGEDVEITGGYYYFFNGYWYRFSGHAVVLTGATTTNGVFKLNFKHDENQKKPGGTVEGETEAHLALDGSLYLPGLSGMGFVNGMYVPIRFYVEGAFAESYDPNVLPPSTTHTFQKYCDWFKRTIPPGKKIVITYPSGTRSFSATAYELDRSVDPPEFKETANWNWNSGSSLEYANNTNKIITVAIHNDDDARDPEGDTPEPYDVDVHQLSVAPGGTTSGSNPEAYGGFSLGGADGGSEEFGSPPGSSVQVEAGIGCGLHEVPARMGQGVQQLTLTHAIPVWNAYWSHLELRLEVLTVHSPGDLQVDCASSGFHGSIRIDQPGTYSVDLGTTSPAPSFAVSMTTLAGLDFDIDAVGLPTRVQPTVGAEAGAAPAAAGLWNLGPNPARGEVRVRFDLTRSGRVSLGVYDLTGKRVARLVSGPMEPGSYTRSWAGTDQGGHTVPAGVYFLRLETSHGTWTRRCVLLR